MEPKAPARPITFEKFTMSNGIDVLRVIRDLADPRVTAISERLGQIQTVLTVSNLFGVPTAQHGGHAGQFAYAWANSHSTGRGTFDALPTEAELWAWIEQTVTAEEARYARYVAAQPAREIEAAQREASHVKLLARLAGRVPRVMTCPSCGLPYRIEGGLMTVREARGVWGDVRFVFDDLPGDHCGC